MLGAPPPSPQRKQGFSINPCLRCGLGARVEPLLALRARSAAGSERGFMRFGLLLLQELQRILGVLNAVGVLFAALGDKRGGGRIGLRTTQRVTQDRLPDNRSIEALLAM